jgi:hypothetical protein
MRHLQAALHRCVGLFIGRQPLALWVDDEHAQTHQQDERSEDEQKEPVGGHDGLPWFSSQGLPFIISFTGAWFQYCEVAPRTIGEAVVGSGVPANAIRYSTSGSRAVGNGYRA